MATHLISGQAPGITTYWASYRRLSGSTVQIRNTTNNTWVNLSTDPAATDVDTAVTEVGTNTGAYSWTDPTGLNAANEAYQILVQTGASKSLNPTTDPPIALLEVGPNRVGSRRP